MDYKGLNQRFKETFREESDEFNRSCNDVQNVQRRKLLSIVRSNCDTSYGKEHHFEKVGSVDDFRKQVPIATYDSYTDYITRIADGEEGVLTREDVLVLEPTSGSTSPSKFIPYTKSLRSEFRKGISPWLFNLYDDIPELSKGSFYWSITPATHNEERTSGGIPIGFGDDGSYFTQEQQELISQLTAVPFDVARIQDISEFRDQTLSYLRKEKDLRFISVWNPTFLSLLLRPIENPREAFRNLSLISAWTEGNASHYISELKDMFPDVQIQGKGLIATEGFVTFPLIGYEGSALSVNSHFFEFKENESEGVRLAHELEKDKQYQVVLTTSGGLYRYNLEDVVQVTGFKGQCPLLRFVGRSSNISDLFGEKLNEFHVSSTVDESLENQRINPSFFILAPEESQSQDYPSYTLFVESEEADEKLLTSAQSLDEKLQDNYHYRYCRKLGQLGPLRVFRISGSDTSKRASDLYLEESRARGKKIGNIKPSVLSSRTGWSNVFEGRFIK